MHHQICTITTITFYEYTYIYIYILELKCFVLSRLNNTRGFKTAKTEQFLPEASFGLRVLSLPACVCMCVCVRVSVNHVLVRAIIHQPFKLGSPNLNQRCTRP